MSLSVCGAVLVPLQDAGRRGRVAPPGCLLFSSCCPCSDQWYLLGRSVSRLLGSWRTAPFVVCSVAWLAGIEWSCLLYWHVSRVFWMMFWMISSTCCSNDFIPVHGVSLHVRCVSLHTERMRSVDLLHQHPASPMSDHDCSVITLQPSVDTIFARAGMPRAAEGVPVLSCRLSPMVLLLPLGVTIGCPASTSNVIP